MADGAWGSRTRRRFYIDLRHCNHAPSAALAQREGGPCYMHKDAAVTSSLYPHLFATLGDAVERLPDDLAKALETTLGTTMGAQADEGISLLGCLQRIRHVEAADGQPWPGKGRKQGHGIAMARIDRANAGLTLLLELLHAIERVRVDGDEGQQVGDDVREGLLLACRGLAEYVDLQLHPV